MKKRTIISNQQDLTNFIEVLQKAEIKKPVLVETSEYKQTRSSAINKLLWLWNGRIKRHVQETQGQIYSVEDIHSYFVGFLLPKKVIEINGKERIVREETRSFNNKEMCRYLELLDMYCAEHLNLILPHPEDIYNEAIGRK